MMFGKLGLVMIVVRDMERSVAFYRDVLGLKLLMQQPNWSQLDAGNIIIGLHPDGEEVKVSPTSGMSIGIYVDDMDAAASGRLRWVRARIRLDAGRWFSIRMGIACRLLKCRAGYELSTSFRRSRGRSKKALVE